MAVGYCMDCKEKRQMRRVEQSLTSNNAIKVSGYCVKCNRKINLLKGRKKTIQENDRQDWNTTEFNRH